MINACACGYESGIETSPGLTLDVVTSDETLIRKAMGVLKRGERGLGAVYCVHYLHDHFLQAEGKNAVGVFAVDQDLGEHQRDPNTRMGDDCA